MHLDLLVWAPASAQPPTHVTPISSRASPQAMHEQLSAFRSNLEEFARKYRADVRRDPVFRAQFHTMCANIGVDPLASNKVWACVCVF